MSVVKSIDVPRLLGGLLAILFFFTGAINWQLLLVLALLNCRFTVKLGK